MAKNKKVQSRYVPVGIRARKLEASKKNELVREPLNTRTGEMKKAIVSNNLQSRYHAK